MAALPAGTKAPDFSLPALMAADSRCRMHLKQDRCSWPSSKCPARCASTHFRILERIYKAHGDKKSPWWASRRMTSATPRPS